MKLSKAKQLAEARRISDLSARATGRTDIDYETDVLPSTHILADVRVKEKPSARDWLLQRYAYDDLLNIDEVVQLLDEYLNEMNS